MKKIIALLLALLLVFSMVACGGEKEEKKTDQDDIQNDIEKDEDDNFEDYLSDYFFPETVLADNDQVTAKITAIDPDGDWGYTVKVFFENKTDKNLMFSVDKTSVNDMMFEPLFATEVTAGQKANEEISFDKATLEDMGFSQVTKIEFTLTASDSEDWSADDIFSETFTVYPLGEESYQSYVHNPAEQELAAFDTDDCTMIITGIDPNGFWGYTVKVYLYNKSDKNLMFAVDNAAINGMDLDPLWACEVAAGKHAISSIFWFTEDFEENGIENVEKLWLQLRVSDADDWMADDIVNEEIEFAPF